MRNSAVRSEKAGEHRTDDSLTREVMDIRQASAYLGISADSLYRYASEGTLPGFRLGNRWRFRKSRLDSWMDEQSSGAPAEPESPKAGKSSQKKPVRAAR